MCNLHTDRCRKQNTWALSDLGVCARVFGACERERETESEREKVSQEIGIVSLWYCGCVLLVPHGTLCSLGLISSSVLMVGMVGQCYSPGT